MYAVTAVAPAPAMTSSVAGSPTMETVERGELEWAGGNRVVVEDHGSQPKDHRNQGLVALDANGIGGHPAFRAWAARKAALKAMDTGQTGLEGH